MSRPKALDNQTHEKLLDVAEDLFSRRGYASVKLREIALAVGIHHASLYYYVPGGKEQLYLEVMRRNAQRHSEGLSHAIEHADNTLRHKLYAVSDWLLSQPPLDSARMAFADLPALEPENAQRLSSLAYDALRIPIVGALEAHQKQTTLQDLGGAAMLLVSIVQSVHLIPERFLTAPDERHQIGRRYVDMILDGWLER